MFEVISQRGRAEPVTDDTVVLCGLGTYVFGDLRAAQPLSAVNEPGLADAVNGAFPPASGAAPSIEDWFVLGVGENSDGTVGTDVIGLVDDEVFLTAYVSLADGWLLVRSQQAPDCDLRLTPPPGLGTVEWVLEDEAIDPAATKVTVLVTEQGCANGQPPGDRLLGPDIVETADEIAIAFAVIPPGEAECPGNPAVPVTFELNEPIGTRDVVDGYSLSIAISDTLGSTQ